MKAGSDNSIHSFLSVYENKNTTISDSFILRIIMLSRSQHNP